MVQSHRLDETSPKQMWKVGLDYAAKSQQRHPRCVLTASHPLLWYHYFFSSLKSSNPRIPPSLSAGLGYARIHTDLAGVCSA